MALASPMSRLGLVGLTSPDAFPGAPSFAFNRYQTAQANATARDGTESKGGQVPLVYGDRIKLYARTGYHVQDGIDGGFIGTYDKHELVAVGPAVNESQFNPSVFTVHPSGSANKGDMVRYGSTIVLVDENDSIWNNKITGTWSDGYVSSQKMQPNQPVRGGRVFASGEMHVSFQPIAPSLMGLPVFLGDTGVSIDVEDSHRQTTKFNTRIRAYRKDSSQVRGGYLVCDASGAPMTVAIVPARTGSQKHGQIRPRGVYVSDEEIERNQAQTRLAKRAARTKMGMRVAACYLFMLSLVFYMAASDARAASSSTSAATKTGGGSGGLLGRIGLGGGKAGGWWWVKPLAYFISSIICLVVSMLRALKVPAPPRIVEALPPEQGEAGTGPDGIDWNDDALPVPIRFINAEKGNKVKGRKRYVATMQWRIANRLETVLDRPHPLQRFIKAHTNHYFYGRSKDGWAVYYETPKAAKLDVINKAGVTMDDLLFHFVYISEFLYQRMDTREHARCVSVVDCTDIGLSDFRGDVVDYVKKVAGITSTHYPERSAGIIMINAPLSFRMVFKLVSAFMDPVTLSKTKMLGGSYTSEMSKLIDLDQIPAEFGGTKPFKPTCQPLPVPQFPVSALPEPIRSIGALPKSPEEEQMFLLADKVNNDWIAANPGKELPRTTLIGVQAAREQS